MHHKRRGIVLTRPEMASGRMTAELVGRGVRSEDIVISSLLRIVEIEAIFHPEQYDGVIFSSENAVTALESVRFPVGTRAYCVGKRTAEAANKAGYNAVAAHGTGDSLREAVLQIADPGRLLYARGRHISGDLRHALAIAGIRIDEAVVYEQRQQSLSTGAKTEMLSRPCILPLFSVRTAQILNSEASDLPGNNHIICCISEKVAQSVTLNWRTLVAVTRKYERISESVYRHVVQLYGE